MTALLTVMLVTVSCKNNTKNAVNDTDSLTDPLENMQGEVVEEIQHNFPEKPFEKETDTTFSIDNKKYGYQLTQKTIDTSMVVFIHNAMGKRVKDVYLDFEYTLKPTGQDYKGSSFKLTKHSFQKEFTKDFINHAVLHDLAFMGFNNYSKEYEFKFSITQPDTDLSYVIYYFINNKGETKFLVDDA
ncbi:MAG: DUF4738 domain-containing protein [bacterium]